jgi:regulatory protein
MSLLSQRKAVGTRSACRQAATVEESAFRFSIVEPLVRDARRNIVASPPARLYASPMYSRSSPRKLSTEQQLYSSALRALMRRAHSIHEMHEYLARRAENRDQIPSVIARLRENNYLDDARYALEYARQHADSRRQGRFRIARELRARGVPDRHIQAALDAVFAETNETALIRERLKRLLAHPPGTLDDRKVASLYRSLLRAGFAADSIRKELRNITHANVPDFPDPENE